MKKYLKWFSIFFFSIVFLALAGLGIYISINYAEAKKIKLDENALTSPSMTIEIFDKENKPIKEYNEINNSYAKVDTLKPYTLDAFVSIEDKDFFKHNGINYKRIAKAMLNNLKAKRLKEGASTITQQLVKNTQLSSEKTFKRKIKEVALAKKIESKYSKNEILEMYLNVIYFGNNCYGIENAANYYFSKSAKDLSIEESALLAGMIKSPSNYSPIKNYDNALKRRNLVLSQMYNDEKISGDTYTQAKNKKIELKINNEKKNKINSYSQSALDEAEKILGLPARQVAINGYKIYTYQDPVKQKNLESAIEKAGLNSDNAGIVIDNKTHAVSAYVGKSNYKILDAKRQPGSCIKPIIVYAPALNEDIIYPCTQLLDEKTTISGYSPKNVGNVYHGYVSARESLAKSINIPAVKVLSYVGIEKAKMYGQDMGINFDEKDDSYTLALGGMTYGVNILQLAGAYTTFANDGYYSAPKFVSFITDKNNKIVYVNKQESKKVLREDATYLLTDMLKTCAKTGTAKKLAALNNDIASKTGTVGKPNSKENLDCWNISYTKEQTCGIWIGNLDNTPISYAGGNQPTEIVKEYFLTAADNSKLDAPSSIIFKNIDLDELNENHRVVLANPYMPERYCQSEIFSKFNLPSDISKKFTTIEKPNITSKVENGNAVINFDAKEYLSYNFYNGNKKLESVVGKSGKQSISFPVENEKEEIEVEVFYTLSPQINHYEKLQLIKIPTRKVDNKWFI